MTVDYDVSSSFKRIENELIDSMMRNLKRHRVEEAKEGFTWEQWQVLQLRELEAYRLANPEKFAGEFADINKRVEDAFRNTYKDAGTAEERKILDQIRKGNIKRPENGAIEGGFFGVNQSRLEHLINTTRADFVRGEWSVLRQANDQYRKIIFNAQMYSATGATYEQAVDMATKDFLKAGIQSITYKNGSRHNIAEYSRMAIRTGQKRAYLMGEGDVHDKYGIHTVRVNKRMDACPLCVKWLGRVLVDDVYAGGTAEEAQKANVPLLSEAIDEGFLHPNCKDIYSLYIEGVSEKAKPWTKKEMEEIAGKYNNEQALQRAEDMRDSYDRMARNSLDPINQERYQARADAWSERADSIRELMASATAIPPLTWEGIRAPIDIKYDSGTIVGITDVSDVLTINSIDQAFSGYNTLDITLKKRVEFNWDNLSDKSKKFIKWFAPARANKSFLIQPKDLQYMTVFRKGQETERYLELIKPFTDRGYSVLGTSRIRKYNSGWDLYLLEKDKKKYLVFNDIEEARTVSKETIDAVIKREKTVSDTLWNENIRFRDLTSRRGDDWIEAMTKFHTAVEADKPVTLVSREAYDALKGEELYRGIAPQSHLRADLSMTKTPMECAKQLMEGGVGDCFPSRGVYGDCVAYLSNSKKVGFQYATAYNRNQSGGVIARMKLRDDAKKITYDDAKNLFNAINGTHPNDSQPYFSKKQVRLTNDVEVGKAMQMLGYDYIYEPRGDGGTSHFYMILNREALVAVKDDWVEVEITPEVARRGTW